MKSGKQCHGKEAQNKYIMICAGGIYNVNAAIFFDFALSNWYTLCKKKTACPKYYNRFAYLML